MPSAQMDREIRPEFQLEIDTMEDKLAKTAELADHYKDMLTSPAWLDFKGRMVNRIHNLDERRDGLNDTQFREWRAITTEIAILRSYLSVPQRIYKQCCDARTRLLEVERVKKETVNG